jgi:Fe-S-cluster containining protein
MKKLKKRLPLILKEGLKNNNIEAGINGNGEGGDPGYSSDGKNDQTLCDHCLPAKCCLYFALEIDTPTSRDDFSDMLWYIAHDKIEIFVEDKKWYLKVLNRCRMLNEYNMCSIYDRRPNICREYSIQNCEYEAESENDLHFKTFDELHEYMEKRFKKKKKKKKRAKED